MQPIGITRHPVLDRNRRLFGYQFQLHGEKPASKRDGEEVSHRELSRLLGDRPAFVNVTGEFLQAGFTSLLSPERVILELQPGGAPAATLLQELREAKSEGFQTALALTGEDGAFVPVYERVDYLRVDPAVFPEETLDRLVQATKDADGALVATNVNDPEQFRRLLRKGFDFFQGQFFTRPIRLSSEPIPAQKANLLRIFRLLEEDAEVDKIEELFKLSPELSYRLLKLLNSAAFAVRRRIQSIRQALIMLGRRNVRKWVAMLLYAGDADDFRNPLLAEAVIRGRMMELAAESLAYDNRFADAAQITGTLSVAEALLNRPMEQVVEELQLESQIGAALLRREGVLGQLLHLVETLRTHGTLARRATATLAVREGDLVFYEQKATLEQATLELENAEEGKE